MSYRFAIIVPLLVCALARGAEVKVEAEKNPEDSYRGVVRVPKQVGSNAGGNLQGDKDHEQSGTHHGHGLGFGHGHHGHGHHGLGHGHYGDSKYFQHLDLYKKIISPTQYEIGWVEETPTKTEMRVERVDGNTKQGYAHNPHYGEYEYGYRRGNDYHFQERYERAHGWNFKTKVKWGDKYAGYGEHYWDYNHADKSHDHGHGGGGGGGHYGGDDGGHGHYSENVPNYEKNPGAKLPNKRQSQLDSLKKEVKGESEVVTAKPKLNLRLPKVHQAPVQAPAAPQPRLTLNPVSGQIRDENTGKTYMLKPLN